MTPRTPKQYKEIREEKRNLIMDVALECFAREGYHNTTISNIARQAGISKGLIYNYFESKEDLLSEIINSSIDEIYEYFDPDRDGYLTEEEFELFITKFFFILREKLTFWRLFYQFLMQKEVRDKFLSAYTGRTDTDKLLSTDDNTIFIPTMSRMLSEYFTRKSERMAEGYDPVLDMNMFLYTLEGLGLVTIFQEKVDDKNFRKAINRIIELYK